MIESMILPNRYLLRVDENYIYYLFINDDGEWLEEKYDKDHNFISSKIKL